MDPTKSARSFLPLVKDAIGGLWGTSFSYVLIGIHLQGIGTNCPILFSISVNPFNRANYARDLACHVFLAVDRKISHEVEG